LGKRINPRVVDIQEAKMKPVRRTKNVSIKQVENKIKEAMEKAEREVKKWQDARKVDPESLHRPVTI
jgi:hypothetical protein